MNFKILILLFLPLIMYSNGKTKNIDVAYYHDEDIISNYKNSKSALDIWINDFVKNINNNINLVPYNNKQDFIDDYNNGKLDIISLVAYSYLYNKEKIDENTIDYWQLGKSKNKSLEKMYLIVNKNSNINNILDLKNKKIAIDKENKFGKFFFEKIYLENSKKNIDDIMSKINFNNKNSLLLQVYFNKYDAAVITSNEYDIMLELNPAINKKINILETSPEIFPNLLIFFNKKNTSDNMKVFKKSISSFFINEDNHELFDILKVKEISRIEKSDLDKLYDYYQGYRKLKSKYKKE
ncbi:phosphate/phosphite/phosphonate ABC transporter substrate-binding protein [Poseidonibacter lekithochrous]|uniref:PhnD/SsuA/transferrin family substrate-binding protein n=1 Tax=Poseidonibacter TaxID=2321187 RepID=UPI001C099421|nr:MULTISPECIES: PhnD/SsuA/transferrin family substrate-binding protein [Poseidonibacter]MBU3015232.1 phosphate/phosphite/phosphonate ABC transporter substrate-binding protein [Poseidonibacter lekithochrous]MDO6828530.1 PhnD/SsuA/transferrin family substrate-binding protein [Poseidonibacter sp. 1_MG-2023]